MTEERSMVPVEVTASPMTVFGTDDPEQIVALVESKAAALGGFVRKHGMSRQLQRPRQGEKPREYVFIEGWSFLGQMLGVAPVTREVREVLDHDGTLVGFEARVELVRVGDGAIVGGAIGECSWAESNWGTRDPFAVKSMAQTRATGKAFRLAYGFVMSAAGFEATPAEEMPPDENDETAPRGQQGGRQRGSRSTAAPTAMRHIGDLLTRAHNEHGLSRSQVEEILGTKNQQDIEDDLEGAWRKIAAKFEPQPEAAAE